MAISWEYIYICICTYTYAHTHTHTYTNTYTCIYIEYYIYIMQESWNSCQTFGNGQRVKIKFAGSKCLSFVTNSFFRWKCVSYFRFVLWPQYQILSPDWQKYMCKNVSWCCLVSDQKQNLTEQANVWGRLAGSMSYFPPMLKLSGSHCASFSVLTEYLRLDVYACGKISVKRSRHQYFKVLFKYFVLAYSTNVVATLFNH